MRRQCADSAGPGALREAAAALSSFASWHPEWWVVLCALAAWAVLLLIHGSDPIPAAICSVETTMPWGALREGFSGSVLSVNLRDWAVMSAAMMLPLSLSPVRYVAFRSLWRRRHLAIAEFLAGYLGVWVSFGVVVVLLTRFPSPFGNFEGAGISIVLFGCATLWQLTTYKQSALRACHRIRPLAPCGWSANTACIRFGAQHGRECLISCWPMMLAASVPSHRVAVMCGVSAILVAERYYIKLGSWRMPFVVMGAGVVDLLLVH